MVLYDVLFADAANLDATVTSVREKLASLEKEKLLWPGQTAEQVAGNVSASDNLKEALEGAVYVQVCSLIIRILCSNCQDTVS